MQVKKQLLQEIREGFARGGFDPNLAIPFIHGLQQIGANLGYDDPSTFAVQALNLIKKESAFNPRAKNTLGYQGLIQFSPNNAKTFGYNPDPLKQLKAIEGYLKSNQRTMNQTFGNKVKNRDLAENGSVLLTSVFTGPSAKSLIDPSASSVKDAYNTTTSDYYKNIRGGVTNLVKSQAPSKPQTGLEKIQNTPQPNGVYLKQPQETPQSIPNNQLTLQEQFQNVNTPPQPPSLNDERVAQVIELLKSQQNDIMGLQNQQKLNQQSQLDQAKLNQQQLKLQQEAELKKKTQETQKALSEQRNNFFASMPIKDDPALPIEAKYNAPAPLFEFPKLNAGAKEISLNQIDM